MFIMMKKLHVSFIALFIYSLASFFITFPLLLNLGNYATGFGDEMLIAWIHAWNIHAFFNDPLNIFQANIFYPYPDSLAFSDIFITSSLIISIPVQILGEPIAANNLTLILSLILTSFSLFLLAHYLTKQFLPSLFSGWVVLFSPVMLDKIVHLQILMLYFVVLGILFFIIYLKTFRYKYLLLALLCFLLQMYNSFMPAYFLIFSWVILLTSYYLAGKIVVKRILNRKNILTLLIFLSLSLFAVVPYYRVSHEYNYTRDIRDAVHLALHPEDLLFASSYSRISPLLRELPFNTAANYPLYTEFKPGFPGITFSVMSVLAIGYFFKKRKKVTLEYISFIVIAGTGLVLSLGPVLHFNRLTIHTPFLIPLPYSIFYYILPGFNGFRNSFRFEMLFILSMAIVMALFLSAIINKKKPILTISIFSLFLISMLEYNPPISFVSVPQKKDFPKVYPFMATTEKNATMIEMPIYNWNMYPYAHRELLRDYFATAHFRKTVNGASGFSPPPWQEMVVTLMETFPEERSITALKRINVQYIIVHKDEYDRLARDSYKVGKKMITKGDIIIKSLEKRADTPLVKQFGSDYLFKLTN